MEAAFIEGITCHNVLDSGGLSPCCVKMQPGFSLSISSCFQRHQGSWHCLCHGGILFLHRVSRCRLDFNLIEVPLAEPRARADLCGVARADLCGVTRATEMHGSVSSTLAAVARPLGHYFPAAEE